MKINNTCILYLVGIDKEDAKESLFFDSFESAQSYCFDNIGTKIYSVSATIDWSTIVKENSD